VDAKGWGHLAKEFGVDTKKCHTYTAKLMMLYEGNCVRKKRKFTGAAALRGHGGAFVCV